MFTHASWVDDRLSSNERLEFLGDSVLGAAVAAHLFDLLPDAPEGVLARARASAVSRESCTSVAVELGLAADLEQRARRLGTDAAALVASDSVLGSVLEAAIGACQLAFGPAETLPAVRAAMAHRVAYALESHVDHKTELQERLARRGSSVTYLQIDVSGPPHRRRFTSVAMVGDREAGRGSGTSKKRSEQAAAREALLELGSGAG
ncbi:MAG TPA: ribonuclease III domain-containing protein [Gaiellales bacterium]|nr:ribonuclease III domain-containing protein [Gaiellales bacterium]